MFARPGNEYEVVSASHQAKLHSQAYESLLSLRIALQRSLDLANKLPTVASDDIVNHFRKQVGVDALQNERGEIGSELSSSYLQLQSQLQSIQDSLFDCLSNQGRTPFKEDNRQLRDWTDMIRVQESMEGFWEATLDKWHSRTHFGSEKVKTQLQVFNVSAWDQIRSVVSDERRCLEKSRVPFPDSERMDLQSLKSATSDLLEENSNTKSLGIHSISSFTAPSDTHSSRADATIARKRKLIDLEVYDDRPFYSLLLKSFIASHSSQSSISKEMMRNDDLAALKRFKLKKQQNVDRRASKGRKIRYTVHSKIQNFMFPIPATTHEGSCVDSDRLFQSLFQ